MNLFRLLRFFLPLQNPIGFGMADYIELGAILLIGGALIARSRIEAGIRWISARQWWSMGLLAAVPIVLRLLLLPRHPVPIPQTSDDFSYLLLGDTLAHFRLANPPHPMGRFFETVFVLQEPTYSSIYPLAQGIALAIGELIFRQPWAGVLLTEGVMCALIYWMLLAWVPATWAFVGGLLAIAEFGPLNQWMNTYWGGAVSAIAGCLVFGAIPRLRASGGKRDAAIAGGGLGLQILARPFEAALVALCALPFLRRRRGAALLAVLPALALTAAHNRAVTGTWLSLPYSVSRYQYGVPAAFTFQKNIEAHRPLTQEQGLDLRAQTEVHGPGVDTIGSYAARLASRIRFYRFFYLTPLYLALPFFFPALRERRYLWVAATLCVLALGTNFYPYFYPHYIAAATCLFVLISVVALRRLSWIRVRGVTAGAQAMRLIALLCLAHFAFWYGLHLFGTEDLFIASGQYESWDFINFGDAEGRAAIDRRLAAATGRQLVIVHFGPAHLLREWIHNASNIDAARVVWALDLGPGENEKLVRYYPDRKVWLLEPDARPPRLREYGGNPEP
ncbi:MAG TPA: hypothetical protein VKB79_06560 [Bryobacteraceae bacterium]|nr:hypothetical protein [Bryobacteraceae bacterium]